MSYLHWQSGMKVALISSAPVGAVPGFNYPNIGQVYTIRSIFVGCHGGVLLRLVEVVNRDAPHVDGRSYEPGFEAEFFRPVQTRDTDISIFTAMLRDTKKKVPA